MKGRKLERKKERKRIGRRYGRKAFGSDKKTLSTSESAKSADAKKIK